MRVKAAIASSALMWALASSVSAATAYTCTMTNKVDHSLVPDVFFIGHNEATKTAQVSDAVVYYFNDNTAMDVKVTRFNASKATYRWQVKGAKTREFQEVTLRYTADINRTSGAFYLAVRVTGLRGQLSGTGKCDIKMVKPKA